MCGRVVAARPRERLAAELGADDVVGPDLGLRWNVAPTDPLYALAGHRENGELRRRLGTMSWGLVPSWATDLRSGPRPINARMESLGDRPHFRGALATRRCLIPVDGFYEWGAGPGGSRRPHVVTRPDGGILAIAAIWDRHPAQGAARARWTAPDAEPLVSCAVVTTPANDDVEPLHDRMPAYLEREDWDEWLDPTNHDDVSLLDLLRPPPPGHLVARPVSRLVNSTANDGPELLADAEPDIPSLFE